MSVLELLNHVADEVSLFSHCQSLWLLGAVVVDSG